MIKCPNCEGNNDGSCPTCYAHGYLVAPIEYWLAASITHALRNRLRGNGEEFTSSGVLDVDFWLGWAFERAAHDANDGMGHALRLAEKRAELASDAFKQLLEFTEVSFDKVMPPGECEPSYWIKSATLYAERRLTTRSDITPTTICPVTYSINLRMAIV